MPDGQTLLYIVLIGLVAGVLASLVIPTGLDLIGAIVVGVIGAAIGFYLFPAFGIKIAPGSPVVATVITSTAGAILLLLILRLVRR